MTDRRRVVVRKETTRIVDADDLESFLSRIWGGGWIEIVDLETGKTLEERGDLPLLQDPPGGQP